MLGFRAPDIIGGILLLALCVAIPSVIGLGVAAYRERQMQKRLAAADKPPGIEFRDIARGGLAGIQQRHAPPERPDSMTALRSAVLRTLYWPFLFAINLGFVGAIDQLNPSPIGTAGPMLPSGQIGVLIGALGVMGCVSIVVSGAGAPKSEAEITQQPLGFRVWVWVANGGFVVGMVVGFAVSVSLWLSQTNAIILMFFAGLAMTVIGIGGLLLREWRGRRRQRRGATPPAPCMPRQPNPEMPSGGQI